MQKHSRNLTGFHSYKSVLVLTSLMVLILVVLGFVFFAPKDRPLTENDHDPSRFGERIDRVGAKRAYEEFKSAYARIPFNTQHRDAHVFGEVVYAHAGLESLSVCDETFSYGCYHGFMGAAISDRGGEIVSRLSDVCRAIYGEASNGCTHGIGHGIMEYEGKRNLIEALNLCMKTGQKDPLAGCTTGVFMEYNNSIVFRDGSVFLDSRKPDPDNVYAPCDTLASSFFRQSCYYQAAEWWRSFLGTEYEKIGNLCDDVSGESDRAACLKGWGTVAADEANYEVRGTVDICSLIQTTKGRSLCLLGAAMRLAADGVHLPEAKEVCSRVAKSEVTECERLGKN